MPPRAPTAPTTRSHARAPGRRSTNPPGPRSDGTLRFTLASLYATLYRLEERGLLRGRWVEKAGQRRRRYYRITDDGRQVLAAQREEWSRFIAALSQVAGVKAT